MFARARRRLTVLYIVLFAFVLVVFSALFYTTFATVLAPAFDIAPEITNERAAEIAYETALERIGLALVVGNMVILVLVAAVAWFLAGRTLRPIEDAHDRQRRFVADASHEMRSPLAVIRAAAENGMRSNAADVRETLGDIAHASARLSELTSGLLLLARTEQEGAGANPQPIDLSIVVAEAVAAHPAVRVATTRRPIELRLASDLLVLGESEQLERIIGNLLDNAFRYSPPSAPVVVATRRNDGDAVLEITDHGIGIASHELERIFQPFYRVRADASAPPGSGLGLAIAAELAKANRGRIAVRSSPGRGSTFQLALPRFR